MVARSGNLVKQLLEKKGITQKELAEQLGLSRSLICRVVNHQRRSRRVQWYIALRLGRRYEDLWPLAA